MKTTLFLLTLIIAPLTIAQSTESEKSSKFTFGWIYSPEVSFRVLTESDQANDNTASQINMRNDQERFKYGQTFNFFFGYQLAKHFRLEAGLGFTDYGEGIKPTDISLLLGPSQPEIPGTLTGTRHYFVSTLPISVQYRMGTGSVQGFVSLGITPSLLTRYMTTSRREYENGDVFTGSSYVAASQDQFTKFILGATISVGIDYRYSEKASMRIAPVFRMMTNSVSQDSPIDGYYFNVGIEFGSVYHF